MSEIDKKKSEMLLIIGNGFDLHCGLNSKFSDFMEKEVLLDCYKNVKNPNAIFKKYNIWYYLLTFTFYRNDLDWFIHIKRDDIKWMDVEDFIKNFICEKNDAFLRLKMIFSAMQNFPITSEKVWSLYNKSECLRTLANYMYTPIQNYKNLNEFLVNELNAFESDFSYYIENESKGIDYIKKAHDTFDKIRVETSIKLDIISFNYTNPLKAYSNYSLMNIHGSVEDKNIIIGIDSQGVDLEKLKDSGIFRFTKAWQKLRNVLGVQSLPSKDNIECIAIYGHSLGEQDYSYFHSIFNYYNIIEKEDICIFFYYSDYEKDENGISNKEKNELNYIKYVDSIYKMLNDYAFNSNENKESKTLITRLMLERKINIIKID